MEMRLEVVQVPVTNVDAAKSFYTDRLGFALDHDVEYIPGMRVVQLTPPGSATSIVIGTGMNSMSPGSLEGLQLVVPDMASTRAELLERGAEISEVQDMGGIAFAYFSDPDGNRWVIQESTPPAVKDAYQR
ncbi:VOC family protein [Arthrobacter sp. B3I4]|uniref:VOC family protein n=1 Tax=Arthrobacter sp. B3I4 TaxID=3042267 RepID=UPI0027877B21|nr:VOC family protein [Arthrobacter sp. B3I4]MDQ0755676.1 catechol 2,3-dioxygenase-like lactoylglutathione lyase family enzyme [Arthrobacter sp. B3I4]